MNIFMLIGLSSRYVKASTTLYELEKMVAGPADIEQARKNYLDSFITSNKFIGYYTDKNEAIDVIKKYGSSFSDYGYYSHIVIEEHPPGAGTYPENFETCETWFKLDGMMNYQGVEKPVCLEKIVCFI